MTNRKDVSMCHTVSLQEGTDGVMFSTRIVTVDHYQSYPARGFDVSYSDFRGCEVYKVPVVRIFGITPAGQKSCLHVHSIFPYLTILCDDDIPKCESDSNFRKYAQELALNIDKAINVALRKSSSYRHHVYKITLASGIPFYGYYKEEKAFLKIYFYNPNVIKKAAELFCSGAIMNKITQPYESHIPYILQFFIDYNLFGMNLINISNLKFRISDEGFITNSSPLSLSSFCHSEFDIYKKVWHPSEISSSRMCSRLTKTTYCELEADCSGDAIMNRMEGQIHLGKNPGLLSIWKEEKLRQGKLDTSEIIASLSEDRMDVMESESEIFYKRRLNQILLNSGTLSPMQTDDLLPSPGIGSSFTSNKTFSDISLCDSQDKEMLNVFLSLAKEDNVDPDHDSVLSLHAINNEELKADEAAETLEMSQIFSEEADDGAETLIAGASFRHMNSMESNREVEENYAMPQLDGAGDDDHFEIVTRRPNSLFAQKQDYSINLSPQPAAKEGSSPFQTIIKFDIKEISRTAEPDPDWRSVRKRRHKSASSKKGRIKSSEGKKNNASLPSSFDSSLCAALASSAGPENAGLYRRRSVDSSIDKYFSRLTSVRTRARKRMWESLANIPEHAVESANNTDVAVIPECLENVDMTKIGREVIVLHKLSDATLEKVSKCSGRKKFPSKVLSILGSTSTSESKISICIDNEPYSSDEDPDILALNMRLKLKWLGERSVDGRVIVVSDECEELERPALVPPLRLKLNKSRITVCSSNAENSANNVAPTKRQLRKRNSPSMQLLSQQNLIPSYRCPLLSSKSISAAEDKKASLKKHSRKKQRGKSHSSLDLKCTEAKHPADIQKDRLNELNLILTRSHDNYFDCRKSSEKNIPSYTVTKSCEVSKSKRKKRASSTPSKHHPHASKTSPKSSAKKSASISKDLDATPTTAEDESVMHRQKLPKLHLKLDTKDRWTCCTTDSESNTNDSEVTDFKIVEYTGTLRLRKSATNESEKASEKETKGNSPKEHKKGNTKRKRGNRKRRSKGRAKKKSTTSETTSSETTPRRRGRPRKRGRKKSIKIVLPLAKSTVLDTEQTLVEDLPTTEIRPDNLEKLCIPLTIDLTRLSDEILNKFMAHEKKGLEENEKSYATIVEEDMLPLVEEDMLPLVEEDMLPLVEEDMLPVVEEDVLPLVEEDMLPLVEENMLPLVEAENMLPLVEAENPSTEENHPNSCTSLELIEDMSPNSETAHDSFIETSPVPASTNCALSEDIPSVSFPLDSSDVMWKLAYFSPIETHQPLQSPPRCWSPCLDIERVKSSTGLFEIKMEPIDSDHSQCLDAITNDYRQNENELSNSPIFNFSYNSPSPIVLNDDIFPTDFPNVSIKPEIVTDSSSNEQTYPLNDSVETNANTAFTNLFPQSEDISKTSDNLDESLNVIAEKEEAFDFESSLLCNGAPSSLFSAFPNPGSSENQHKMTPTGDSYKGSLLYERLTDPKQDQVQCNDVKIKNEVPEITSTGIDNLSQNANLFSVIPSTQLSFYSTLDDEVVSLGSSFSATPRNDCDQGLYIPHIKQEKDDSCDLFGSEQSKIESSFPQCSYENISSSSDCYLPEFSDKMKFSLADHSSKKFSFEDNNINILNDLPADMSTSVEFDRARPEYMMNYNNLQTEANVLKEFSTLKEPAFDKNSWQNSSRPDLAYMNGNCITKMTAFNQNDSTSQITGFKTLTFAPHVPSVNSRPAIGQASDVSNCLIVSPHSQDPLNEIPIAGKSVQNLSEAPQCVLVKGKLTSTNTTVNAQHSLLRKTLNNIDSSTYGNNTLLSMLNKRDDSLIPNHSLDNKIINHMPNNNDARLTILPNFYSQTTLPNKNEYSPPNISEKVQNSDKYFSFETKKEDIPPVDNDDILSKIVKSCNIDMEFEYSTNLRNSRGNNYFLEDDNEFQSPVMDCQASNGATISKSKDRKVSIPCNSEPLESYNAKKGLPNNYIGGISPTQPHSRVGSQSSLNRSRGNYSDSLNDNLLSSFPDIHSFYGDETINPCSMLELNPNKSKITSEESSPKSCTPQNFETPALPLFNLSIKQEVESLIESDLPLGSRSSSTWQPMTKPPTKLQVKETMHAYNIPEERHVQPFYSDPADSVPLQNSIPGLASEIATYKQANLLEFPCFIGKRNQRPETSFNLLNEVRKDSCLRLMFSNDKSVVLTPAVFAPSSQAVTDWLKNKGMEPEAAIDKVNEQPGTPLFSTSQKSNASQNSLQANKFSTLTRLLGSPIVKDVDMSNKMRTPATSTPISLSNRNKRYQSVNFGRQGNCLTVEDATGISTPKQLYLSPSIASMNSSLTSVMKKRKLFSNDDSMGDSLALKVPKVMRNGSQKQSSKLQHLLMNNSFNSTLSQIEGPTLENSGGFKINLDCKEKSPISNEHQHLTLMSLEIHVNTRSDFRPDPQHDPISAIFISICEESKQQKDSANKTGMIAVYPENERSTMFRKGLLAAPGLTKELIFCVNDENQLFDQLSNLVKDFDPDIVFGYEIQNLSLGYIMKRASYLGIDLNAKLSRLLEKGVVDAFPNGINSDVEGSDDDHFELKIIGRIVLNLWRIMRKEVTLNIYSFENVFYHVLHRRVPLYSFQILTEWYQSEQQPLLWKVVHYYALRASGNLQLLEGLNVISRTSELARVFGIQFYEVLSRGTQFRVESMMLRFAKPLHYIPVSPSIKQRSLSKAPECIPLILEPESKFYVDPVVVLDFQSLYPSMVIAYNYCFSTCLGRVDNFGKTVPFEFGCTSLSTSIELLEELKKDMHIAPTGVAFVKSNIRQGILPLMLADILNTRVIVKQSLKMNKSNKSLSRLLDARQLGLKLIANVTYGYTSANFSGRMPCVEVADSIVSKGRETLERAIRFIESSQQWKAKVVYGDTDSVFVLLPGRSKEQAFKIGQDIADAVTAMNPKPVKLKFEKVYMPCVLQTKKRYVGYMYETLDQKEPAFDAKGIETVRRDSCSAVGKMLEKSLKILFDSRDVSLVKKYVQKQFKNLLSGRTSMIDCIFAKEYRGKSGYRPGACVPALEIARKRLLKDPQSEPCVGERVPYVVVYGFPDLPVIQLVREPSEVLADTSLRINAKYYISRVIIPPLNRVFSLIGADAKQWYASVSHVHVPSLPMVPIGNRPRGTLSQYFAALSCPSCEKPSNFGLCSSCQLDRQTTAVVLSDKIRNWERTYHQVNEICVSCTKGRNSSNSCQSLECPVLYRLNQAQRDLAQAPHLRNILHHELF